MRCWFDGVFCWSGGVIAYNACRFRVGRPEECLSLRNVGYRHAGYSLITKEYEIGYIDRSELVRLGSGVFHGLSSHKGHVH